MNYALLIRHLLFDAWIVHRRMWRCDRARFQKLGDRVASKMVMLQLPGSIAASGECGRHCYKWRWMPVNIRL
jgi:hypothetical protein